MIVHSKKSSLIPLLDPLPSETTPAPKPAPQPRPTYNRNSRRTSVFTMAAAQIMQQNPDLFDNTEAQEEAEADLFDNELDWSPGSEFAKFASIVTVPPLMIAETAGITEDYMTTLRLYKSEFTDTMFSASNRSRTSRMRIFTGRQFVEFCLSDTCRPNPLHLNRFSVSNNDFESDVARRIGCRREAPPWVSAS